MKEKIIYVGSFMLAFVLVTGLLIYLNSIYKNIFAFDFSVPVKTASVIKKTDQKTIEKPVPKDSTIANNVAQKNLASKIDSMQSKITNVAVKDSAALQKENAKLAEEKKPAVAIQQTVLKEPVKVEQTNKNFARRDSLQKEWVKNTAKLYESMDSRKAAKIIQGYSDNIARDLLLTMKKKKAAEILAEFKPETVTRIISAVQ